VSRFDLHKDQIKLLSFDELENLRMAICDEMCSLTKTEYSLYKRRRELELELHPELVLEPEPEPEPETVVNTNISTTQIQKLLNAALEQGLDITTLFNQTK